MVKANPNIQDGDACLPNGLQYGYYDKSRSAPTAVCGSTRDAVRKCMYRMPGNTKSLERFLSRPPACPDGVQPNEVIASLSDCPIHFSIDEYKSFGALPYDQKIIYSIVVAQLATPSIDFMKVETHTLLPQIIEQTVSNGLSSRSAHTILRESALGNAMLEQLEICLDRLAENCESWRSVATFVALSQRILSLTVSPKAHQRSLKFLATARHIIMTWLNRLKSRATASIDDTLRTGLYSRAPEVALLCFRTFDVEGCFVDEVFRQPAAVSIFLQCSIVVQENHGSVNSESPVIYKTMLQSWKTLMYRTFPRVRHCILQGDTGLDAAVLDNWAGFNPATRAHWKISSGTYEHWLCIASGSLTVYFDLLTA